MTRCVAVASSFLPADELATVLIEYAPALERAGVSFEMDTNNGDGARDMPGPFGAQGVLFVVTGGTEQQVMDLVDSANTVDGRAAVRSGPVTLIAYPGRNSLPASLEVLARLQQDGVPGRIVFLDGPGDEEGIARLREAVPTRGGSDAASAFAADAGTAASAAAGAKPPGRILAGRRIGLIGEPSDWLVASSPDPGFVRDAWGADVVAIALDEVVRRMGGDGVGRGAHPDAVRRFSESFAGAAAECVEPTASDLDASGHIYVALRSLIEDHELDAVTVRCFDLVTGLGATGCLALSRLTDEGVIAGCEGDIVSALGLMWAREATGETPWMANPARIDINSNALTLAHCTVPCSIVDSYSLRSHFESGLGAAVAGVIPNGSVTLLRVGGRRLDRVWVAHGEITGSGCDERMCRTQVDVRLEYTERVSNLLEHPLGNHLVLVRGHHSY